MNKYLLVVIICTMVVSLMPVARAQNKVVVIPMAGEDLVVPRGTNFITLTPSSFIPRQSTNGYSRSGPRLIASGGAASFDANLPLPHGATIDKVTVNYYDNSSSSLSLAVYRVAQPGRSGSPMASVSSSGMSTEARSAETSSISNSEIDLEKYAYYALLSLPDDSSVEFNSMRIDYSYGD